MKARYIPNILSVIRILMIPVFALVFFNDYPKNIITAMLIFAAAGATDVVDGYLARRNGWTSNAGKLLDPFADKAMQATVLICLYIQHIIPLWLLVAFFAKELLMVLGAALVFRKKNVIVVSKWCGKLAVCIFYAGIFALIIMNYIGYRNDMLTIAICALVAAAAVFALVYYIVAYSKRKNYNSSAAKASGGEITDNNL